MSIDPKQSPAPDASEKRPTERRDAPVNGIRHKGPLELRRKQAKVTMSDQTLLDT